MNNDYEKVEARIVVNGRLRPRKLYKLDDNLPVYSIDTPKGAMSVYRKIISYKWFMKECESKYGDKYDYSLVNFTSNGHKVPIVCKEHGRFYQTPWKHMRGRGCPKCMESLPLKIAATDCNGNLYDYSNVEYVDAHTRVEIVCNEHGSFYISPQSHKAGNGCPICASIKLDENLDFVREHMDFMSGGNVHDRAKDFQKKFSGKYEISTKTKTIKSEFITFTCPDHGTFRQSGLANLNKDIPCPMCLNHKLHNDPEYKTYSSGGKPAGRKKKLIKCPNCGMVGGTKEIQLHKGKCGK